MTKKQDTNMEEKLIEAIKDHSCLFDKSTHLFRNKFVKAKAWDDVAKTVGIPVEHCQKRWKSLRDRFVREVAGQIPKSGAAANDREREWCYLEPMMFLKTHVTPRKTVSNLQWGHLEEETSCSSSLTQAPETEVMSPGTSQSAEDESSSSRKTGGKRRRVDFSKADERFDRLCGVVEKFVENKVDSAQSSPNAEFFAVLDQYLQKHSQERQDQLKIEMLNMVNNSFK